MTFVFFEELKAFLEAEVATKIKLKRPLPGDSAAFELVEPAVHIGWAPVAFGDGEIRTRVPGIAIGLAGDIVDDGKYRTIPVQLALIVYSSGSVMPPDGADGNDKLQLDRTGYQDLLNLMDVTVRAIRNAPSFGPHLVRANEVIEYAPDNEEYYDFWVGSVTFAVNALPAPRATEAELI